MMDRLLQMAGIGFGDEHDVAGERFAKLLIEYNQRSTSVPPLGHVARWTGDEARTFRYQLAELAYSLEMFLDAIQQNPLIGSLIPDLGEIAGKVIGFLHDAHSLAYQAVKLEEISNRKAQKDDTFAQYLDEIQGEYDCWLIDKTAELRPDDISVPPGASAIPHTKGADIGAPSDDCGTPRSNSDGAPLSSKREGEQ